MISVYQSLNGHAPAVHWWLATNKSFGPQVYQFMPKYGDDPNHLGAIVMEVRNGLLDDSIYEVCLLYTSPSPRDLSTSRMPSSA